MLISIIFFAKYVELGQIIFDGHGIGIYGWEVLNEEVPLYRNDILTVSLLLLTAALIFLNFSIRTVWRKSK